MSGAGAVVAGSGPAPVAGLVVIALALLAIIPAQLGFRKGYSGVVFYLLGLFLLPVAVLAALVLPSKLDQITVGTRVKVRTPVRVSLGSKIPAGHRSTVLAEDEVEGRPIVEITDHQGTRRWIERANTVPV